MYTQATTGSGFRLICRGVRGPSYRSAVGSWVRDYGFLGRLRFFWEVESFNVNLRIIKDLRATKTDCWFNY